MQRRWTHLAYADGSSFMSELPSVTGLEAIKAFARVGFVEVRIKGSHHVLKKSGYLYHLTVPVHKNQALKTGTIRRLIRDAGLSVDEFVELLKK